MWFLQKCPCNAEQHVGQAAGCLSLQPQIHRLLEAIPNNICHHTPSTPPPSPIRILGVSDSNRTWWHTMDHWKVAPGNQSFYLCRPRNFFGVWVFCAWCCLGNIYHWVEYNGSCCTDSPCQDKESHQVYDLDCTDETPPDIHFIHLASCSVRLLLFMDWSWPLYFQPS